jgi:hypothetical protein
MARTPDNVVPFTRSTTVDRPAFRLLKFTPRAPKGSLAAKLARLRMMSVSDDLAADALETIDDVVDQLLSVAEERAAVPTGGAA